MKVTLLIQAYQTIIFKKNNLREKSILEIYYQLLTVTLQFFH